MKKRLLASAAFLAAMVGLSQFAKANASEKQFTPVEELSPAVRQQINSRIGEMTKSVKIDWDAVVVGLNEKGEICFRKKSEVKMQVVSGYSCATGGNHT